jgi:uncharacterized RmlC-like cupin family protein
MTNQTPAPGVVEFAVGGDVGTSGVWLGHVTASPGSGISPVHHHRESEALVYVLVGTMTFIYGEGLKNRVDLTAGDFLFIPPWTLHAEANFGEVPAELVMARSTPRPIAEWHPEVQVAESVVGALR